MTYDNLLVKVILQERERQLGQAQRVAEAERAQKRRLQIAERPPSRDHKESERKAA